MAKKNKIKKKKKLSGYTPKQAAFFYHYSITGNATRSALKAYYPDFPVNKAYTELSDKEKKSYDVATQIGFDNLRKHNNPTQLFMDKNGMDFGKLIKKLDEGLDATKTSNAAILVTKDGKTEKAEEQGLIEVPDYAERREWWDRFARIMNVSIKESPNTVQQTQVNVFNKPDGEMDEFIEGEEVE